MYHSEDTDIRAYICDHVRLSCLKTILVLNPSITLYSKLEVLHILSCVYSTRMLPYVSLLLRAILQ